SRRYQKRDANTRPRGRRFAGHHGEHRRHAESGARRHTESNAASCRQGDVRRQAGGARSDTRVLTKAARPIPPQIEALKTGDQDAFDAKERAILTYCESITHEIHVPDAVLNSAKEHFSESEKVERSEERRVGKERRSRWPRAEERRRGERANTRGAAASATWTRGR